MKKLLLISILMGALPFTMVAQDDDLYFASKKKTEKKVTDYGGVQSAVYHSGSNRSVDEYNRMESKYVVIDNDSVNDIITFSAEKGVYPDSLMMAGSDSLIVEDYALTKKMMRFDDYDLTQNAAFWAGYHAGMGTWNWHSPWYYYSYGWYDPWYYGWHDPWYYGWYDPWYYGWRDPWYYGYYGWYGGWYDPWRYGYYGYYSYGYPYFVDVYYGGAPRRYSANRTTGSQNHGRIDYSGPRGISNGRTTTHRAGTFGGSAIAGNRTSGTRTTAASQGSTQRTTVRNASGNFGGNRANSTYSNSGNTSRSSGNFSNSSTRTSTVGSSSSSMGSSSSGSFGGSRSSGSTIGGSRSGGGGGSFGGGRHR